MRLLLGADTTLETTSPPISLNVTPYTARTHTWLKNYGVLHQRAEDDLHEVAGHGHGHTAMVT